ncbi:hypothetical protein [Haloferax elongans]|uniref:hypothetical protein n=1 Tax=Haloferax elongans TaxID=403191 RepID=UPI00135F1485|nr:hypothetical protein [Haloferax elongans]
MQADIQGWEDALATPQRQHSRPAHSPSGVLNDFQFGSIQFLIEVLLAQLGDTVQTLVDAFEKTVFSQFPTPDTRVLTPDVNTRDQTISTQCDRGQVPILADNLKDPIVNSFHPVRPLAHGSGETPQPDITTEREYTDCQQVSVDVHWLTVVSYWLTTDSQW